MVANVLKFAPGLINSKMLSIEKTNSNKPYLTDSKDFISLSHKNELYILARSSNPIGLDIECYSSLKTDWRVFNKRFFTELDIETANTMTQTYGLSKELAWLLLFSAKEAYLKLIDLKRDPLNFYVTHQSFADHQITFRISDLMTLSTVQVFWNLKQIPEVKNISMTEISNTRIVPDILSIATF